MLPKQPKINATKINSKKYFNQTELILCKRNFLAKITEDDLEVTSESRDVVPDELPSEGTKRLQAFKRQHTYWTSVNEATSMHQNNLDYLALSENRIHYDYGSSDSASTSRELNPVSRWSNRLGSIPRKVKGSLLHKSYSVREHPDVRERRTQNQTLLRRCDSLTTRTKERYIILILLVLFIFVNKF